MLFTSKIFRRFLVVFLALSLIPPIIASLVILKYSISEVHRQSLTQLHIAVDGAEAQVLQYLHFLKDKTTGFASDKFIVTTLEKCYKYPANWHFINRLNYYLAFDKLPTFPVCIETFVLDLHGRVIASTNTSHRERGKTPIISINQKWVPLPKEKIKNILIVTKGNAGVCVFFPGSLKKNFCFCILQISL